MGRREEVSLLAERGGAEASLALAQRAGNRCGQLASWRSRAWEVEGCRLEESSVGVFCRNTSINTVLYVYCTVLHCTGRRVSKCTPPYFDGVQWW